MHLHSWMAPLARYDARTVPTPVTGTPIIGGLVPCNVIAEEILTDHPRRFRAMLVESSNPAHSLADSKRFRAALDALELVVVIDVAMTETARHADYVLPAASQFEKWEATFFNLEFPRNTFHLRAPLLEPLPGTLPEPEIHARLMRALDVVPRIGADVARRRGTRGPGCVRRRHSCRRRWATGRSARSRRISSTRRSVRRCRTGRGRPPRCGDSRIAAR